MGLFSSLLGKNPPILLLERRVVPGGVPSKARFEQQNRRVSFPKDLKRGQYVLLFQRLRFRRSILLENLIGPDYLELRV